MIVILERYGPVLDSAIGIVRELAAYGRAEVRVPRHPEAAGMAADIYHLISEMDPSMNCIVSSSARRIEVPPHRDGRNFRVDFLFERMPFEVPDGQKSLSYKYLTTLQVPESGQYIAVNARGTLRKPSQNAGKFAGALGECGIELPPPKNRITLLLKAPHPFPFAVRTVHQTFEPRGSEVYYPVSRMYKHVLDRETLRFFSEPLYWNMRSRIVAMAVNDMAGKTSYEEYESRKMSSLDALMRVMPPTEPIAAGTITALREGRNLDEVAAGVNCPPHLAGIFLREILRAIRWFCNPDALKDGTKRAYLDELAKTCGYYGVSITTDELAKLPERRVTAEHQIVNTPLQTTTVPAFHAMRNGYME